MLKIGETYKVKYPFIRCVYTIYDEEGYSDVDCWRPGCREIMISQEGGGLEADGEGEMILEIISVHKPGKYPERIFYIRKWKDPSGEVFGRVALRICTTAKFKRLSDRYYYDYELAGNES